ncbi:hypothetical protein Tco_1575717 [Tanacetum coccineum]
MILELADRTISTPTRHRRGCFRESWNVFFPADFVVIDYVADPRAPLYLRIDLLEDGHVKSSCEDPPDLELKDLPSHLEYAFLEGDDKLPVIIAKNLKDEDKTALIKPWVSPVHCVPKKGGITVVKNEENELIPTRLVTGWRVCIDYRKLNDATRYFQILFDNLIKEKTTIHCHYGTFAYRSMPLGYASTRHVPKCHFMVKEGIVLGHKISKSRIEVDKAKVDFITKLPHPTTVKGIRSFLGHAGFYDIYQDFSKIARPYGPQPLEEETPFIFSQESHRSILYPLRILGQHRPSIPAVTLCKQNYDEAPCTLPLQEKELLAVVISPDCEDSRARSIHKSFTASASFWESSIQI